MDLVGFDLIFVQDLIGTPDKAESSTDVSGSAGGTTELQVSLLVPSDELVLILWLILELFVELILTFSL